MKIMVEEREVKILDKVDSTGNIFKVEFKDTKETKNVHSKFIKFVEEEKPKAPKGPSKFNKFWTKLKGAATRIVSEEEDQFSGTKED